MGGGISLNPLYAAADEVSTKGNITLVDRTSTSDTTQTSQSSNNGTKPVGGNSSNAGKLPSTGELVGKSLAISGFLLLLLLIFFFVKKRQKEEGEVR